MSVAEGMYTLIKSATVTSYSNSGPKFSGPNTYSFSPSSVHDLQGTGYCSCIVHGSLNVSLQVYLTTMLQHGKWGVRIYYICLNAHDMYLYMLPSDGVYILELTNILHTNIILLMISFRHASLYSGTALKHESDNSPQQTCSGVLCRTA